MYQHRSRAIDCNEIVLLMVGFNDIVVMHNYSYTTIIRSGSLIGPDNSWLSYNTISTVAMIIS